MTVVNNTGVPVCGVKIVLDMGFEGDCVPNSLPAGMSGSFTTSGQIGGTHYGWAGYTTNWPVCFANMTGPHVLMTPDGGVVYCSDIVTPTYGSQASIVNWDSVGHNYQGAIDGVPVGPPVWVPPGGTYSVNASGSTRQVATITQLNSDGGAGTTYTGNMSTNYTGAAPDPQTPQPSNPGGAVYQGSTTNINWGAGANTNAAVAVMSSGSALYDVMNKGFAQNHADLSSGFGQNHSDLGTLHSDLQSIKSSLGNGSTVNVSNSVSVTNNINFTNQNPETWSSNLYVFATNAQNVQTSKLAGASSRMLGATNGASVLGNGTLGTAAEGMGTWSMSDGGGGSRTVTIGTVNAVTLDVESWDDGYVALGKSVASWAISLWLFVANYRVFKDGLMRAATAPQATTSGEAILGSNVNFASALIVAALIVAAVGTIPAFFLPKLIAALGTVVSNPFGGLASTPAWAFVGACLPVSQLVASIGSHIVFRLSVDGMVAVIIGVIRFLVGL